jgi:hypothetical protein
MTVTLTSLGSTSLISARNRDERTTSRVVTPKILWGEQAGDKQKRDVPLGIVNALLFVDLGEDGNSRVDRVGNDADHGFGAVLRAGNSQVANDGGIGVEQVVAAEASARLGSYDLTHVMPGFLGTPAGMTTISAPFKAPAMLFESVVQCIPSQRHSLGLLKALDSRLGVDMTDISSDTGCAADIVEA